MRGFECFPWFAKWKKSRRFIRNFISLNISSFILHEWMERNMDVIIMIGMGLQYMDVFRISPYHHWMNRIYTVFNFEWISLNCILKWITEVSEGNVSNEVVICVHHHVNDIDVLTKINIFFILNTMSEDNSASRSYYSMLDFVDQLKLIYEIEIDFDFSILVEKTPIKRKYTYSCKVLAIMILGWKTIRYNEIV